MSQNKIVKENQENRYVDSLKALSAQLWLHCSRFREKFVDFQRRKCSISNFLQNHVQGYSTVTLFARFRGWSTSHPLNTATW